MELYYTADMSLVAYLTLQGHQYQGIDRKSARSRECVWAFAVTGNLLELVDSYQLGDAQVEPLDFQRSFASTRAAMFDFLNAETHAACN